MGTYDNILIKCRKCGKETNSQTKLLGDNTMQVFEVGDTILFEDLANCILKLKENCVCGCENAIIIKDGKIVGVENPKYANVTEGYWGDYERCDELERIVKEKLKQIEDKKNEQKTRT